MIEISCCPSPSTSGAAMLRTSASPKATCSNDGLCVAVPGDVDDACDETVVCSGALTCVSGTCAIVNGGVDAACDETVPCLGALACLDGTCTVIPDGVGETCHNLVPCITALSCFEGICIHEGAITVSLSWTDPAADLDISVMTPDDEEISLTNPSAGGGLLDVDDCAYYGKVPTYHCTDPAGTHVESVYCDSPATGHYSARVLNYSSASTEPVQYSLTIRAHLAAQGASSPQYRTPRGVYRSPGVASRGRVGNLTQNDTPRPAFSTSM